MSGESYLFTSESVSEGHPDKVADQISDSILDALLEQDKYSRVACETLVKTGIVVIAGEITSNAKIDYAKVARDTILEIGYNDGQIGFDGSSCGIITTIDQIEQEHKTKYAPTFIGTMPGLKITKTPTRPISKAPIRIK